MGDFELPVPDTCQKRVLEEPGVRDRRRKRRVLAYITLLKNSNHQFRWKTTKALGTTGDAAAIEPPLEALKDPFVDIQWLAAKSPGRIGDRRCVRPLLNALKPRDK
jgi:HEAT repeat protein